MSELRCRCGRAALQHSSLCQRCTNSPNWESRTSSFSTRCHACEKRLAPQMMTGFWSGTKWEFWQCLEHPCDQRPRLFYELRCLAEDMAEACVNIAPRKHELCEVTSKQVARIHHAMTNKMAEINAEFARWVELGTVVAQSKVGH